MIFSSENITTLNSNEIFVFGSNEAGIHGKGAAKYSLKFGSKYGIGIGLCGKTYAIPTKDKYIKTLPISSIKKYVDEFIDFAIHNPNYIFLVTKIGTGLAGYNDEDIAVLFTEAIKYDNIRLPEYFYNIIINEN